MIIMKYSLSLNFTLRRVSSIIERMYGCDINKGSGSLWLSMKISRVFDGSNITMITFDTDDSLIKWGNNDYSKVHIRANGASIP